MEFMKLGGFLGDTISKLIAKLIEKKMKFNPVININKFTVSTLEDTNLLSIGINVTVNRETFDRIMEELIK